MKSNDDYADWEMHWVPNIAKQIQEAMRNTDIVVETSDPRNLFCSILVEEGLNQFCNFISTEIKND